MGLDMNFGIYYTHKRFYAGFGMTHITQPELQLDENAYTYIGRSLNLMGGYNIQLKNPLIELQPSVFLLTDMQSFHADITARLEYNKMFNGGFSYRVNESVGIMFGVKLGRFHAGYAFDFPTTALGRASSGSHELCVKYALKLNKTKTGKNRHKSVPNSSFRSALNGSPLCTPFPVWFSVCEVSETVVFDVVCPLSVVCSVSGVISVFSESRCASCRDASSMSIPAFSAVSIPDMTC